MRIVKKLIEEMGVEILVMTLLIGVLTFFITLVVMGISSERDVALECYRACGNSSAVTECIRACRGH